MKLNTVSFTQFKNAIPVRSAVTTSNDPNVFGFDHIDSKGNLVDPQSSIAKLEFNDGEGRHIDGFRVTYRYKGPNSSEVEPEVVVHGTFNEDEVHHKAVTLDVDEYICAARVWYAKGDEEYIGRITLWARSPKSKHAYQAGDWGDVPDGEFEIDEWQWENKDGRLLAFGAKQDLSAGEKGLKAVAFGVFQGQFAVAQSALYPERDASSQANAKAFDDLEKYGQNLNYEHPIKSVEVWHDRVIHGIRITYQLNHKATTATEMHGSKTTSQPTLIQLKETESIVEVTGVHGVACPDTNWGNRINILDFKIFDKKTGMFRNSGLYNLKFFTRVPPWKPNSVRF